MARTRALLAVAASAAALCATAPAAGADPGGRFTPGAPGIDDPYFPLEGNGGYDTKHYDLSFSYDPATDRLEGISNVDPDDGCALTYQRPRFGGALSLARPCDDDNLAGRATRRGRRWDRRTHVTHPRLTAPVGAPARERPAMRTPAARPSAIA